MRVYLAHSSYERELGQEVKKTLESIGFEVLDPFVKEGSIIHRKDVWKNGKPVWNGNPSKEDCNWIVYSDLEGLLDSDIVVCIFPQDLKTFGVTCEMFFPFSLKVIQEYFTLSNSLPNIPVFVYIPEAARGHPWLIACSDFITDDLNELYEKIGELID